MPFQKGNTLGNKHKGRKISEETRAKLVAAWKKKDRSFLSNPERNRKISESRMGAKHPLWAGDNVSKSQLHQWVKRHKPRSEKCEICGLNKKLDLANVSQNYKRDINDFKWLCRRCHMIEDNRIENKDEKGRFKK